MGSLTDGRVCSHCGLLVAVGFYPSEEGFNIQSAGDSTPNCQVRVALCGISLNNSCDEIIP